MSSNGKTDLDFLTEYRLWPRYPWCPVKRNGVMGCVFWNAPVVYLRNIWSSGGTLDDIEKIIYPTLAALCEDGWRVD